MTRGSDVGGRGAFAEHQLDRISGDQVDEEEDQGDYEPDDWQGVEDALEEGFQALVSSVVVILRGASAKALAESKDPFPLHATLLFEGILSDLGEIGFMRELLDAFDESAARVGILDCARSIASLRIELRSG